MLLLYSCPLFTSRVHLSLLGKKGESGEGINSSRLLEEPENSTHSRTISGCQSIFVLLEREETSQTVPVGVGYNIRTKLWHRDRLLQLDLIVYFAKMTMSHLVMKTLINVFLSLLLLTQTSLGRNINGKKKSLTFFLFIPFPGEF